MIAEGAPGARQRCHRQRTARVDMAQRLFTIFVMTMAALFCMACAGVFARVEAAKQRKAVRAGTNAFGPNPGPRGRMPRAGSAFTDAQKRVYREEARAMFYHAYDSYIQHAFPADDLAPLSCSGIKWTGGVAATLIDSLDMLLILGNATEFERAVGWLSTELTFDVDVRVNVFETNIRLLGGLLGAHQLILLSHERNGGLPGMPALGKTLLCPNYDGQLLDLAGDLARRLLPAFTKSKSSVPLAWVNLRSGVMRRDVRHTCTAGAGTLLLEFTALQRLGDSSAPWEALASSAASALFEQRSTNGLVGNTLDADSQVWMKREASIGAGVDSFFEYLLKSHLLHGKQKHLDEFASLYVSSLQHMRFPRLGRWLYDVDIDKPSTARAYISSLGAFFPGMQALMGDTRDGALLHAEYGSAFREFGFLPELFTPSGHQVHPSQKSYPLRPEHAESAFLLHRATGDDRFLREAAGVLEALRGTRTSCGYAAVKDVKTKVLEDRMESFFLSETVKYLYLAFDEEVDVLERYVLTTEGHLFPLNATLRARPSGSSWSERTEDQESHETAMALGVSPECAANLPPLGGSASGDGADKADEAVRTLARGRRCAAFMVVNERRDAATVASVESAPSWEPPHQQFFGAGHGSLASLASTRADGEL